MVKVIEYQLKFVAENLQIAHNMKDKSNHKVGALRRLIVHRPCDSTKRSGKLRESIPRISNNKVGVFKQRLASYKGIHFMVV